MKKLISWLALLAACVLATGCAHPISMAPDLDAIQSTDSTRIQKSIALNVSDAARSLEVTTAGGGGDKVKYLPYRDLEPGIYKALNEVFAQVTTVKTLADAKTGSASLVLTPEITTHSFSDSLVTWPPTKFAINLTCKITDAQGSLVETIQVSGDGFAPFEEFKSNFSLSAVRASNDTLRKLMQALRGSAALNR